ncbi:unnamed protein product [Cuscuta epithymum]|uniref:Uncharacterized protein n=1 Tax=Cuscuta epithymum TaxID=186058 RepID=A0AAV0E4T7_9ASTE|nr:unnamed protein product [Cuscuta epithymum]
MVWKLEGEEMLNKSFRLPTAILILLLTHQMMLLLHLAMAARDDPFSPMAMDDILVKYRTDRTLPAGSRTPSAPRTNIPHHFKSPPPAPLRTPPPPPRSPPLSPTPKSPPS